MNMNKMLKVISELEVSKNRRNDFSHYDYRSAEDVLQALKPLVCKYGIIPIISDSIEVIGDRYYVKATVVVYDAETGDILATNAAYAREALNKKGMDEAQITGSSSSYARKYALAGIFNLSPAQDPDELEPPKDEPPKDEPPKDEYKPIYSTETLINLLASRGIDTRDFVQLVFHKNDIGELSRYQIDSTVEKIENAVAKYMQLDANR